MGATEVISRQDEIKQQFIAAIESKLRRVLLLNWALGAVLDMAINDVIERKVPKEELFRSLFITWREKCRQLVEIARVHNDDESHFFEGLDMSQLSLDDCQNIKEKFARLSIELGIQ